MNRIPIITTILLVQVLLVPPTQIVASSSSTASCKTCGFVFSNNKCKYPNNNQYKQFPSSSSSSSIQRVVLSSHSKNDDDDDYNSNNHMKEYFATCIPGLSSILSQELVDIGASNVEISGSSGVKFTSSSTSTSQIEEDIGMKALMYVRTAHRLMELITTSSTSPKTSNKIHNRDTLYNFIQSSLSPSQIQSLFGNGNNGSLLSLNISIIMNNAKYIPKELCHSHYTSLTVKNALVDYVRDLRDDKQRPNVDLDDPDVPFMVVLKGIVNNYDGEYGERKRKKDERYRNYNNNDDDDDDDYNDNYYYDNESYTSSSSSSSVEVSLFRILHHNGSSLHRRGYRSSTKTIHKAAMKESLASGLLLQSGWDKLCYTARYKDKLPAVLIDPMCGSATFCIEAASIASDYAPGLMRMKCFENSTTTITTTTTTTTTHNNNNYNKQQKQRNPHFIPPVVRWKDSNRNYWKKLVLEARDKASSGMEWMNQMNDQYTQMSNCVLLGNELNPGAFDLAISNVHNSGFDKIISLTKGDCIDWNVENSVVPGRTIIVSNPPWGLRLTEDIEESWISLKSFLRDQCNDSEAWILSGNKSSTKYLRMKKTRSFPIQTAEEDLRWIQYHIFKKKALIDE